MRMAIVSSGAIALLTNAGCLPPLPVADDGTTGGANESDGSDTGDITATDTDDPFESTGGSTDASDESTTDDTTGDPPWLDCPTIDALRSIDGTDYKVGNCQTSIWVDPTQQYALKSLYAPGQLEDIPEEPPEDPPEEPFPQNVLLTDTDVVLEKLMGVLLYEDGAPPDDLSSWAGVGATFDVLQTGPVMHRFHVTWSDDDVSTGSGMQGDSIYTLLADGRLMRDENVHVLDQPASGDWLVAYVALKKYMFTHVRWREVDGTEGEYQASGPPPEFTEAYFEREPGEPPVNVCAWHSATGRSVGFAPYPSTGSFIGARASRTQSVAADPDTDSIALQADWARAAVIDASYYRGFVMTIADLDADDPCGAIEAQFPAYVEPPTLTVIGGGMLTDSEEVAQAGDADGDFAYDGFSQGGGFYSVITDSSPLTLQFGAGETPPTLLLHLVNLTSTEGIAVSIDGELVADEDVLVQVADEEQNDLQGHLAPGVFVLIGRAVMPGETIEITF